MHTRSIMLWTSQFAIVKCVLCVCVCLYMVGDRLNVYNVLETTEQIIDHKECVVKCFSCSMWHMVVCRLFSLTLFRSLFLFLYWNLSLLSLHFSSLCLSTFGFVSLFGDKKCFIAFQKLVNFSTATNHCRSVTNTDKRNIVHIYVVHIVLGQHKIIYNV